MLIKPSVAKFEYVTPQVFVSDNPNKAELSSFAVYHELESNLIKIDLLGHSDPTMLKELHEFTGYDFRNIKFNDKELYKAILEPSYLNIKTDSEYPFVANTMGISEMNSDFTMRTLRALKPKNMYDMIAFSGLTHGTAVLECQLPYIEQGWDITDLVPYRDIIFKQLSVKYGFEPKEAFMISEFVRKGKGIEKWKKELLEKCPNWYVDILDTIIYAFPCAHATAYIINALRIMYYKIHYPQAFYAAAINRYGVTNTSNNTFDYIKFFNEVNTNEELYKFHAHCKHASDNEVKVKNNIRIGNIVYEMKLRGFEIVKPDFSSKATTCVPDKKNPNKILMPLNSIAGVGSETAKTVELAYKTYGDELFNKTQEELAELKVEKDGKLVKAFGKKFLEGYFSKTEG
jgi:DNA polymerase III, alpha subunit